MGDRTTPMKFGPEWLRNLSREPRQSDGLGGHGSGGGFGSPGNSNQQNRSVTSIASPNTNALTNTSKVLLAKLRYGREEMLALYDSETAEAPPDLLCMDSLYYPRGKAPYALSNNFEDETRDVAIRRSDPPIGSLAPDRYTAGRGRGMGMGMGDGVRGRVTNAGEGRGRARLYVRQTSTGSETFRNPSWHNGVQRGYSGAPEDDSNPRWNNNGSSMYPPGIGMRTASEQTDWATRMAYRKTRQNNTNWRQQQNRDEGEEWRADGVRRGGQEKWSGEREWPEKPAQDRSWNNNNRRTWGDNSEDTLPEWAVENSEGYAGTFDSLGAFHGYSHDDSNIPKQEASHPLARSHTHGSFARSKTIEEGSDEWWASEKAKKLSAKRFDATEVKFKKPSTPGITVENTSTNTNTCNTNPGQMRDKAKDSVTKQSASQDETHHKASPDLQDEAAALPSKHEHYNKQNQEKPKERTEYQSAYSENSGRSAQNRIDRLLQTEEIEPTNERGNYKSVMMATNNNPLRQKHQNIGAPTNHPPNRLIRLLENAKQNQARQNLQSDEENKQKQQENKLVEEILDMKLDDEQESSTMSKLMSSTNQATVMASAQLPRPGIQMRMNNLANAHLMNQQSQNMPSQGSMMRPLGMHNSMLNASLGLNIGAGSNVGMPLTSMATPLPNSAMLSSGLQGLAGNMQGPMQGMQSGLQPSNLQVGSMQSGIQIPGMQANSYQSQSGMPGNMQGAMANTNLESGSGMSGFTGVSGVGNNSLFMQQGACTMQNPNDMSGHGSNMYPMQGHGLQQSSSQSSYNASLYANMIQPPQPPIQLPFPHIALTEQWYYEDPKKVIQGPFTSKEMMRWYLAGFFSPQLLVRRACDSEMTPLANYGLMPFGPMDIIPPQFNRTAFDLRSQLSHDNNLMNNQPGLGPEVESLWSQPTASDMMWMQQTMAARDDNSRINTLPMYFWDQGRM